MDEEKKRASARDALRFHQNRAAAVLPVSWDDLAHFGVRLHRKMSTMSSGQGEFIYQTADRRLFPPPPGHLDAIAHWRVETDAIVLFTQRESRTVSHTLEREEATEETPFPPTVHSHNTFSRRGHCLVLPSGKQATAESSFLFLPESVTGRLRALSAVAYARHGFPFSLSLSFFLICVLPFCVFVASHAGVDAFPSVWDCSREIHRSRKRVARGAVGSS